MTIADQRGHAHARESLTGPAEPRGQVFVLVTSADVDRNAIANSLVQRTAKWILGWACVRTHTQSVRQSHRLIRATRVDEIVQRTLPQTRSDPAQSVARPEDGALFRDCAQVFNQVALRCAFDPQGAKREKPKALDGKPLMSITRLGTQKHSTYPGSSSSSSDSITQKFRNHRTAQCTTSPFEHFLWKEIAVRSF